MLLYIIRHGEPIYDPDTLTPLGKEQAEALGKRLSVHGFDKIYSSPNGRARETAEPTCKALGAKAEILPWASEDLLWRDLKAPDIGWAFNGDPREIKTPELTATTAAGTKVRRSPKQRLRRKPLTASRTASTDFFAVTGTSATDFSTI